MNRFSTVCLAALFLAACQSTSQAEPADTGLAETSDGVATWRDVAPDNLLLIDTEHGRITVELNPDFAPEHANRMREIARTNAYEGARFYRVIDAFVAQGGLNNEEKIAAFSNLKNENDRPISDAGFIPLGNADLFAEEVGHIDGFPVGRSAELGREWLLHCPGAMAMARNSDPDSGGTEFYIVLDAQRYLDRNLTVFGRVISGMDKVQKLKRGNREIESGVIQPPEHGDLITGFQLASQLPKETRPAFRVMNPEHPDFEAAKTAKRVREDPFFYRKPPEILDICGFEPPVEQVSPAE
jgi:peptidylprolyl isomerase